MINRSVLLIEDNPGDARLFREMLNEGGWPNTRLAQVGRMSEAETHLAKHAVGIILLDLDLPDVRGLEGVRRARAAAPRVPLVVLTGSDDESLASQALQAGAQDYLVKGQIETRGLIRAMRYAIERRQSKDDAEKRSIQTEDRYRALLEAAPDAMVVVNHAGEIVLLNVQAEVQFGYRRDELLGQKVTNLIPDGFAERLIEDSLRSAKDARAQQFGSGIELVGRRKDGSHFPVEIMLSPLESEAGILVTAAIRDITARKEESTRVERLKDEFVATVSHELRTPLTSIAGSLALLMGNAAGKLPDTAKRLLAIAHANSERLVRLVDDILAVEKMASAQVVFHFKRVEVGALLEQAIGANLSLAQGYNVRIRLDRSSEPADVRADPDRLIQVVTNLLSNAIKFSPPGEAVVVSVETRRDTIRISVRNSGLGIPEEFKAHLFERFAQADTTDKRQKGGTGLGLSIVKQIVQRLGGEVNFADAPEGGTIFHVDLPSWAHAVRAQSQEFAKSQARILLCEDDAEMAIVLSNRLQQEGFVADVALTPKDALDHVAENTYAAVLVDLQLPDSDVIGLIKQLRSQPQIYDTLLVVLSVEPDPLSHNEGPPALLNILDWLELPIDIDRLVRVFDRPVVKSGKSRPRVLHFDGDRKVLRAVAKALDASAEILSVDSVDKARRALAANRFDVAVLNVASALGSGFDLLHELRDNVGDAIPLVVFSPPDAAPFVDNQFRAALIKSRASVDSLMETLRRRVANSARAANENPLPSPNDKAAA